MILNYPAGVSLSAQLPTRSQPPPFCKFPLLGFSRNVLYPFRGSHTCVRGNNNGSKAISRHPIYLEISSIRTIFLLIFLLQHLFYTFTFYIPSFFNVMIGFFFFHFPLFPLIPQNLPPLEKGGKFPLVFLFV